jgi:hypothetical protein
MTSRGIQQQQRRSERAHTWTPDDTFRRVFAEVVAWHDAHHRLHPPDERDIAVQVAEIIHPEVRTGLTDNQRRMLIVGAVQVYCSLEPQS